jgi:hypothetical protein
MTSAIFSFSPEQVRNDAGVYFMDTGDDVYLYAPAAWLHLIVIRCEIFLHLMGCRNNLFTDSCHALKEFGGEEMWIAF